MPTHEYPQYIKFYRFDGCYQTYSKTKMDQKLKRSECDRAKWNDTNS